MAKFIYYVSLDQDEGLAMFFFSSFGEIERGANIEIYSPIRDRTNNFILIFCFT